MGLTVVLSKAASGVPFMQVHTEFPVPGGCLLEHKEFVLFSYGRPFIGTQGICAVSHSFPENTPRVIIIKLLKIHRHPMTGFALCGAHQAQSPGFRQPYVLIETKLHEISEYTPTCKPIRQLNVLHQAASCFSRYDIRDIAIHVYLCNVLLIRLLKIRQQPTTGFALFKAHQCNGSCQSKTMHFDIDLVWCSTFSCLEISQTRDSAGFQASLSKNRMSMNKPSSLDGFSSVCHAT
ncbi:LOW QUALITY PROTEIN: hypothetical protein T265_14435 [Opisthorchis viverrini]|uniref:Uncharacterized protein n=1 Tax=Opisthorchis viverrini TaxID=6198 RepID=A0A074ZAP1_OPIVI|nr:LOW QUALITY PROTEIN: hypothetical protein T265_14435 [Opisthorchis viverrini]KER24371.1 LOW QUALITY PROTEIN: hypothetical protein T265_14435 [Opisthorchis viverrini]